MEELSMEDTINYYNSNAKKYFDNTVNADMSDHYRRFLKLLPKGSYIMDAGCGSGRDSKYFLTHGYKVKAIDGSSNLCELASKYLDQEVENVNFINIDYHNEFDGIWACASLLHVNKEDITLVIQKLQDALKDGGVLYASFKYGNSDRVQGGRYYNDMSEESVKELFNTFDIKDLWMNDDVRPDGKEKWINIIAAKYTDDR